MAIQNVFNGFFQLIFQGFSNSCLSNSTYGPIPSGVEKQKAEVHLLCRLNRNRSTINSYCILFWIFQLFLSRMSRQREQFPGNSQDEDPQ